MLRKIVKKTILCNHDRTGLIAELSFFIFETSFESYQLTGLNPWACKYWFVKLK